MLQEFQEKATNWAKIQFATLATAITIVTVVLGYVGFSSINVIEKIESIETEAIKSVEKKQKKLDNEYKKRLSDLQQKSDDFELKTSETLVSFNTKVKDADEMIDIKKQELAKFNSDKIEKYEKNLKQDNEEIQTQLNTQVNRIGTQIDKINKLENSRFQILVHYREASLQLYNKNINILENTLFSKGFILNKKNIANVNSDRQEIIYYSESIHIKDKIKEIRQLLSREYNNIPIRLESADNFDPLQIVIKLCPQVDNSGSYCIINSTADDS